MNPNDLAIPVYCITKLDECETCAEFPEGDPHYPRLVDEDDAVVEFGSIAGATAYALNYFGVRIETLEPINKRGPHFE